MKPALTKDEWERIVSRKRYYDPAAHALAAECLYNQPFGFTREDVDSLRYAADDAWIERNRVYFHNLADRIEALLPPEE